MAAVSSGFPFVLLSGLASFSTIQGSFMLQQRRYRVDDLVVLKDPAAEVPADTTIRFSVNGTDYEIDLTEKNGRGFYKALKPYIEAGRRRPGNRRSRSAASRVQSAEIRQWARERGYNVKDQGRVPADIVAKYQAAVAA